MYRVESGVFFCRLWHVGANELSLLSEGVSL